VSWTIWVVGLFNNSYKPITNTAWVCAWLCKLQKGCTRLAAANDKVYQLLAYGRWFSHDTPASSTIKTGRNIAESGVKRNKSNQIKLILGGFVYIVLCYWCISWVTVTLTHISAEGGVYCRDNIILQRVN
jgi:hypothetical protein